MFMPNDNSRASVLHAYVCEHLPEAGDIVTYAELRDMLDVDEGDRFISSVLSPVIALVNKKLHRDGEHRHLVNVENVGYRIASPSDIRVETLGRLRHIDRQQVMALRAMEKAVRHPDASASERKRAADAVAQQAALMQMTRREQAKLRRMWPADEVSPVESEA
jgi:DNA-binding winged helix-turn-helix (wHTH) protein